MNQRDDHLHRDAVASLCPFCGMKRVTSAAAPCWLCHEWMPELTEPLANGPVRARSDHPVLIGIALLVILVTIALAIETPGLLVILALAATPGLIRAVVVSKRGRATGEPLGAGAKVGAFLGTLGAVVLVGVAAGVAFFATCFAVCMGILPFASGREAERGMIVAGWLAGIVSGLIVFIYMVRYYWVKGRT